MSYDWMTCNSKKKINSTRGKKAMKGHLVKYTYLEIIFFDERSELTQDDEVHEEFLHM